MCIFTLPKVFWLSLLEDRCEPPRERAGDVIRLQPFQFRGGGNMRSAVPLEI